MFQKALNDNVYGNKCLKDKILWFHLECPRFANKFDDPVQFKRTIKRFFDYQYFQGMHAKRLGSVMPESTAEDYEIPPLATTRPEDTHKNLPFEMFYNKYKDQLEVSDSLYDPIEPEEVQIPDDHKGETELLVTKVSKDEFGNSPMSHEYWKNKIESSKLQAEEFAANRKHFIAVQKGEVRFLFLVFKKF